MIYTLGMEMPWDIQEAIAAGGYDFVDKRLLASRIQRTISLKSKHAWINYESRVKLVHFGKKMQWQDVLSRIAESNLTPGFVWDLLALGSQEPDLQRRFPIINPRLSKIAESHDAAPCLCLVPEGRALILDRTDVPFESDCRFLVRESRKTP